ncbi:MULTISPECIES: hypothetical protein [Aquimarina]|uniref:hypothetical protein n=1 Tax=Aquimarina TaxID=290174 RepID=UPI0009447C13|nr:MULTISPECIES: hypothetical protein [Aquimarina]
METTYKIDDPTIKVFEISRSSNPIFEIRRKECPFNDNIKIIVSEDQRKKTVRQTLVLGEGIEKRGEWLRFKIDWNRLKRKKKVCVEIDGYGNGNRQMIFEIKINKSAI